MTVFAPFAALHARLSRFRRATEGSVTTFSLFIFFLILLIAGMAVDLMRFETKRTALQNMIDTAVLAGANLRQEADCETLIRDFMAKGGYDDALLDTSCDETLVGVNEDGTGGTLAGRSATAHYDLAVNTMFMKLMNIEVLNGAAGSTAAEEIQPIEISLVLDISGSMRWDAYGQTPSDLDAGNRINKLKTAVQDFLREVLNVTCDPAGTVCTQSESSRSVSVNIIPYAGNVNPGPRLFELMGGRAWHTWSHCKEVTNDDFDNPDLPTDSDRQLPHYMVWSISWPWMNWGFCPKDDAAIMVMQNDYEVLNDYVQNLKLHDGTATHIGMKYGVALLNPTSRDEVSALAAAGLADAEFAARPANWDDDARKIVVLMTDGNTTDELRPRFTDTSGIWKTWSYERLEAAITVIENVRNAVENGSSVEEAVGQLSASDQAIWFRAAPMLDQYGSLDSNFEPIPQEQVESFYPPNDVYKEQGVSHKASTNEENIMAMCDEARRPVYGSDGAVAKSSRIVVYTIAFMAPSSAQTIMRDCATTPGYFFNVQDVDIGAAFSSIASQINKLRLTQ